MIAYLIQRIFAALITVFLALTLAFIALRIIPGDAISAQLAGSGATPQQIVDRRAALGFDLPVAIQYLRTLGGVLHGDLGRSLISSRPVTQVISEQFGATAALAASALIIGLTLGVALGIVAALADNAAIRLSAAAIASLTLASPIYWTGTLAIYLFGVALHGALPSAGGGDLRHLILPASVLGLSVSGGIARVTAASVRDTFRADFVRTARAKGLRRRQVIGDHVLRASLAPLIAVIALQAGFLLGGAVITETLFVRPGIGRVLIDALTRRDLPVVQGVVMLSALLYSVVNTFADLLTALLDPRVRAARTA